MSSNKTERNALIGRRTLLQGGALIAGAAPVASAAAAPAPARSSRNADAVVARADTAVVEIQTGKIAGYTRNGVFTFKGVPYGDTTEGANRFRPPRKPKPWTGVRSSRQYGLVAPQDKGTGRLNDEEAFMFQWNDSVEGEDCLRINVWTPGINDNGKRPVMVWLHGGGFAAGSGNDLPAFDGENLSRRGDVVVVSLNHRLNLLGFMDLSKYGDSYAQSGNVGMLDIVAALEWVRDNIAAFGGDPHRVLVFGQSGGGSKVGALLGMPSAKGLFHRAIVQSGSFALTNTPQRSGGLTDLMLAELGVDRSTLARLHSLPYAELRRASEAVLRRVGPPPGGVPDVRRTVNYPNFAPVVDGKVIPEAPFNPNAPILSADVPMIIGTTLNEFATGINHPEFELMSEGELKANVERMFGGQASDIIATFRRRTPKAKPFDLWSHISSAPVRQGAIAQAASKAALGRAPAYLYWFTWQTPVLDGRPRAYHCAELPFVFYNMDRCDQMTGGGARAHALGAVMADAWIQFARTGDPNHPGMPKWPKFDPAAAPTMIFDDVSRVALGPDREEQASIATG
ncbi:MAG: carboxylesterase family protein [Caulobacteraceae bacterium]